MRRANLQGFVVVSVLSLTACGSVMSEGTSEETTVFETDMEMSHGILLAVSTLSGVIANESDDDSDASSSLSEDFGASTGDYSFDRTVTRTIGTWNTSATFPATPTAMFGNATFATSDSAVYRYPAGAAYEEDFYDELGNRAYMELRESTDGWGAYQVSLFIYPTLSTSVRYNLEQYRVPADTWDTIVNKTTGASDPTAFENYKAYYFDNRIETRSVVWTRWVPNSDGSYSTYPADSFTLPTDFSDSVYTYPASVAAEEPTKTTVADTADDYASHTTYTIQFPSSYCTSDDEDDDDEDEEESCTKMGKFLICHVPSDDPSKKNTLCVDENGWTNGHKAGQDQHSKDYLGACISSDPQCPTMTGEEFYTKVVGDSGTDFFSKAYTLFTMTRSTSSGDDDDDEDEDDDGDDESYTQTEKTVRRYHTEPDLDKTIRAKTAGTLSGGDYNKNYTITEEIKHHDDDGDNQNNFEATFTGTVSGTGDVSSVSSPDAIDDFLTPLNFTLTVTLEETSVGSNSLSGTLQYTAGGKTNNYTVTLSRSDGVKLKKKKGGSSLMREESEESTIYDDLTIDPGIVGAFDEEDGGNFSLTTDSGTLTGRLGGGFFDGVLTLTDGTTKEIQIGTGWIASH